MSQPRPRILVAEPDRFLCESVCAGLGEDFESLPVFSGTAVIDLFTQGGADAVLANAAPGGISGAEVCARLRALRGGTNLPLYLISDEDDDTAVATAFASGATDFLLRPVNMGIFRRRLLRDIAAAARMGTSADPLDRAQAESELFSCLPEPAILVGKTGAILAVNSAFERVFARKTMVVGAAVADLFVGMEEAAFEAGRTVTADLVSRMRGRVPVRVTRVEIASGPWRGSSVYLATERFPGETLLAGGLPMRRTSILVLEDYDVVARSMRRLLEKAGHRVSVAASADEALTQFREALDRKEPFELAVLDIAVPGSEGGADVLKTLRGLAPELKAVVASGAWADPAMRHPEDYGFAAALRKPFSRDELLGTIAKVLAGGRR
jgi:CheY-like chemotaxis protein